MTKLASLCSSLQLTKSASMYSLYVLGLLLFAYLLNQLDRYTLAIVTKPLAQELHYGDLGCMKNESIVSTIDNLQCSKSRSRALCEDKDDGNGAYGCKWDFTGYGFDYQILAGPVFILIYTFAGIPLGLAADSYNRKLCRGPDKETNDESGCLRTAFKKHKELCKDFGVLLGICVIFWSLCTLLSGFVNSYWELVILRFGLGLGQSGCSPFATSLISDYFAEQLRGAALGVYNWGIYTGYSMSFAVGNFITQANINNQGWRWTFILAGIPGIFLGLLIMITVREPKRVKSKSENSDPNNKMEDSTCSKLTSIGQSFFRPSVLLLCFAGSIRNAAGYVWAYNTQAYFEGIGETRTQIGFYMSWIPMVAGSIGVVLGGFISDRFVKKSGPHGRIWVLIASQILAAPFAAGVLLLPTPWAYISLIPTYIIGEMWVGVTLAVLVELVPQDIKTTSVAVYFFIISNIGGNMPLMVPIMRPLFEQLGYVGTDALRMALLVLYPGEYVIGSLLFLLTLLVLRRDIAYIQSLGSSQGSKSDIVTRMEGGNNNQQQQKSERELTKM